MPMEQLNKHIRKLLREAMGKAYERELTSELEKLNASFERWGRGELSPFELTEEIHRFHQGPNRELFSRYQNGDSLLAVAAAVSAGFIRLDELHPDLHAPVEQAMTFFASR